MFGSVGRCEPDPRDLDIGVLTEHGADIDLFGLVTDLIGLVGSEQVDVAHLNAAGPRLRECALVGSIILYQASRERGPGRPPPPLWNGWTPNGLRQLSLDLLAR